MATTQFQRSILKLLAARRKSYGESYVAGGVALNLLLSAPRLSRDIDLFHDTEEALYATWVADRLLLLENGYAVQVLREAPAFVEALVSYAEERTLMQWARDSAYRFFPLIEDDIMGLALHPFDLATNKVLAMVGRLEPRDWIDIVNCDVQLQPFGFLVWAACGKDPGFNPKSLLSFASRAHYSQAEIDALAFDGSPPDAKATSIHWHKMLFEAQKICEILPAEDAGKCIITTEHNLFRGSAEELEKALTEKSILLHEGRIGGSLPAVKQ